MDVILYEELFHCGQAKYYGVIENTSGTFNLHMNLLQYETEIKICRAYSGVISSNLEPYLVEWSKESSVIEYFNAIKQKISINETLRKSFLLKKEQLAKQVWFFYRIRNEVFNKDNEMHNYWLENAKELIQYRKDSFVTPYFDSYSNKYKQ